MWQHFLEQYWHAPWVETVKGAWHTINTLLLLGGLFWISQRLKAERRRIGALVSEFADELNDKLDTAVEIAKAARSSAEAAATAAHVHGVTDHVAGQWPQLQQEWQRVRNRVDAVVASVRHPLSRRKLAALRRDDYGDLIGTLCSEGHLPQQTAAVLTQANDLVAALKANPSAARREDIEKLRELTDALREAPAAGVTHASPSTRQA